MSAIKRIMIVFFSLLLAVPFGNFLSQPAAAVSQIDMEGVRGDERTIIVNASGAGDHTQIQLAIDDANDGDTIYVQAGIYHEDLVINKTLNVLGDGTEKTFISGVEYQDVVVISGESVNISGFNITHGSYDLCAGIRLDGSLNTTISDCYVTGVERGVSAYPLCYFFKIQNCTFTKNGKAIDLYGGCSFNSIRDNTIFDNALGIEIYSGQKTCTSNRIINNTFHSQRLSAISLESSNDNVIFQNNISNSKIGFELFDSDLNVIAHNIIYRSTGPSIRILNDSHGNTIHHNTFIDNNLGDIQALDNGMNNSWNTSSEGNFWSDLIEPDDDFDGIVDAPYNLAGDALAQDHHPLVSPPSFRLARADAGTDVVIDQHGNVTFNSTGCPNGDLIMNHTWYFTYDDTDRFLYGPAPIFIFHLAGTYRVILTIHDELGFKASDEMTVTVLDTEPPEADAGPDSEVRQGDIFHFDASNCRDNVGIANYTWYLIYDQKEIYLYGETPEFIFHEAGMYPVILNVTDERGNWATDSSLVFVTDNSPPVADAGSDISISQGEKVLFDGSGSFDNVGIINYTWRFSYNGTIMTLGGKNASFTFNIPGAYVVTLTVSDTMENTGMDILNITVKDIIPPVAVAGPDMTLHSGDEAILDGSKSSDNVGVVNYTWLFFYNGTVMVLRDEYASFQFNHIGDFTITLIVSDRAGNTAQDNLTVTVPAESDNNETSGEKDSDGDGYNDTDENESGSDPYDGNSTPVDRDGDGYTNAEEEGSGSNPDNARSTPLDWDGDGVVNERDAYPYDASRWTRSPESDYKYILVYVGLSFVFILASILIYTRIKGKNVLGNRIRRNILNYIRKNPGNHYSNLLRQLNVSRGTLTHHLRKLEEGNLIVVREDGKFKYFHPPGTQIINFDLTPGERRVYEMIQAVPGSTVKEVSERYGKSKRTIYHHLDNLSAKDIVFSKRDSGEHQWYASEERG